MCISAWVRDKIGVIWGDRKGLVYKREHRHCRRHTDQQQRRDETASSCWPPKSTTTITTAATSRWTVRRADDCRQYGRLYYMKVAIRNGRYGVLVSSDSTGRKTGSLKREVKSPSWCHLHLNITNKRWGGGGYPGSL